MHPRVLITASSDGELVFLYYEAITLFVIGTEEAARAKWAAATPELRALYERVGAKRREAGGYPFGCTPKVSRASWWVWP